MGYKTNQRRKQHESAIKQEQDSHKVGYDFFINFVHSIGISFLLFESPLEDNKQQLDLQLQLYNRRVQ